MREERWEKERIAERRDVKMKERGVEERRIKKGGGMSG